MYPRYSQPPYWNTVSRYPPPNRYLGLANRWIPALSLFTGIVLVWKFRNLGLNWRLFPDKGDIIRPRAGGPNGLIVQSHPGSESYNKKEYGVRATHFELGSVKPVGEPYTKMIVVSRTISDNTDWVQQNFGSDPHISHAIYTVDDPSADLHPPTNKGREVMVYLSYIIDYYHNLSDVNIFMHSDQNAWRNDGGFGLNAVQLIARLSSERVQRVGYMNMRCQWDPGCPHGLHSKELVEEEHKQQQALLAQSWAELFPLDAMPDILAQPCCAQFAVSKATIRSIPLVRYSFYRDWLLHTQLSDEMSSRVFEYIWQFIFTGQDTACPKPHICYCDGFGICFGGEAQYDNYWEIDAERLKLLEKAEGAERHRHQYTSLVQDGQFQAAKKLTPPEEGLLEELQMKVAILQQWQDDRKLEAMQHGDVARNRAKEAGRPWKDGDGF
ncbi:hypothetical protein BP5796_11651 [Coleophoma crateriformis]|uniref:Uncharacterized protein n=1 Tax=Coleophoma crateriformis TaxID=565419 RepID=A0A3D8QDZ7_9HELO|nr:hypothetical protein BP5796_11651 [Coleophoma crateriformis]